MADQPNTAPTESEGAAIPIKQLKIIQDITIQLGATLDLKTLLTKSVSLINGLVSCNQVMLFHLDPEGVGLKYGAANKPLPEGVQQDQLKTARFSIFNVANDVVFETWLKGETLQVEVNTIPTDSDASKMAKLVDLERFYSVPLMVAGKLTGVLLIESQTGQPLTENDKALLKTASFSLAIAVENARVFSKKNDELETRVREMQMLQQIDRELNDTIELNHVFSMTLDWALRFTNAQAASLALYDEIEDRLRIIVPYGYDITVEQLEAMRPKKGGGIAYRVARTGRTEVTPDITMDSDYIMVANNIRSQMSIPVMREDRVIAVITLESRKLNGFTDDHVEFVEKLATRAAVAIDNARLFTETEREREKLSHILRNIGDVVIVVGLDEHIMLISQSALSALRLYTDKNYTGKHISTVLEHTPLIDVYNRASQMNDLKEGIIEEVELPNDRVFHTQFTYHDGIGWIIVLQDITPFKEMDKLKSELIATVSHDLKQPLSVMTGYLDLLGMKNTFDEQSSNFVRMIDRSIRNMRQLIDDLLDLAKIESGIDLALTAVPVRSVLLDCIESIRPAAENKSMTIIEEIPEDLPAVRGEQARLRQIFDNLISNAVKYTPPEGTVWVSAESRGAAMRITIKDNGLGISPEDQAHIFDRFYRVRRPETDSIDGTGLGLAIVKTLIEAHHGKIGLESHLGEGSTFYVTLPTD